MNDPGAGEPIEESFKQVTDALREQITPESHQSHGLRAEFRHELEVDDEEEEMGFAQAKRWWFTSTAFPLIAGTFGPLANLFSICALVQTWRVSIPNGGTESKGVNIKDPPWLLALNSVSLALALVANFLLLFNFAHRVRYAIAQPFTIILWYTASIFLIVPLGLTRDLIIQPRSTHAFTQSYYYALISAALYVIISSLLVFNMLGAYVFKAYPPSFNSLTIPQRTLMLQTVSYILYLALGAGIFSAAEGWKFVDGLYWADYTLLTIGLGTDFPLQTKVGKALLIPYAACGITMLGLVIGSVRGLVLERGKMKVIRRTLGKERQKYVDDVQSPSAEWKRKEFDTMRRLEQHAEKVQKYTSLGTSFIAYIIVWFGGALVFWFAEEKQQEWTYFKSLYFAYTTLLTIGYGDFFPQSNSGKPFFVIWSLIAVPTVTVLISNMSGTVIGWLKNATLWIGERTILPERKKHHRMGFKKTKGSGKDGRSRRFKDKQRETNGLGGDVEKLGNAVEKVEKEQEREGSLAAKLAKEISRVAKDVGRKPPKKYDWDEWANWLELLGMDGSHSRSSSQGNDGVQWTWLSDEGPLFSQLSETEWVLGKLCTRLEEVLKQELGEARHRGDEKLCPDI